MDKKIIPAWNLGVEGGIDMAGYGNKGGLDSGCFQKAGIEYAQIVAISGSPL